MGGYKTLIEAHHPSQTPIHYSKLVKKDYKEYNIPIMDNKKLEHSNLKEPIGHETFR